MHFLHVPHIMDCVDRLKFLVYKGKADLLCNYLLVLFLPTPMTLYAILKQSMWDYCTDFFSCTILWANKDICFEQLQLFDDTKIHALRWDRTRNTSRSV